jgi:hypothetical protein
MQVEPDCVYVIPPNRDMSLSDGRLHLTEPDAPRGQRLPIDFFFRSLATGPAGPRAICVLLSGTGSDGTLGLRMIKGEGGMAMAQDPETTEYPACPERHRTGWWTSCCRRRRCRTAHGVCPDRPRGTARSDGPKTPPADPLPGSPDALETLFALIRDQTGHDFSEYKDTTVHRRLQRRMAVQQVDRLEDYVRFLKRARRRWRRSSGISSSGSRGSFVTRRPSRRSGTPSPDDRRQVAGVRDPGLGARVLHRGRGLLHRHPPPGSRWRRWIAASGCRCSPPTSTLEPSRSPVPACIRPASRRTCRTAADPVLRPERTRGPRTGSGRTSGRCSSFRSRTCSGIRPSPSST